MKIYLCASRGAGILGKLVRLLNTLAMRRVRIREMGYNGPMVAVWLFMSFFKGSALNRIRAHVNHVFMLHQSSFWAGWFCVEIDEDGPMPKPADKVLKGCKYVEVWEPSYDLVSGVRKAKEMLDGGYDWRGVGGFLLAILKCIWDGRRPVNSYHSKKRSFCSEYVALCINLAPESGAKLVPESTAPIDLALMWREDSMYSRIPEERLRKMGVPLR